MNVRDLIIDHERLELKPYRCTSKKLTIGVGRNLDDRGISKDEAMYLLSNDLAEARKHCEAYTWFAGLSEVRQAACLDLMFNLGALRLSGFTKFIAAMSAKQYARAAAELKNSLWYGQVGRRGPRVCSMILNDRWPE